MDIETRGSSPRRRRPPGPGSAVEELVQPGLAHLADLPENRPREALGRAVGKDQVQIERWLAPGAGALRPIDVLPLDDADWLPGTP